MGAVCPGGTTSRNAKSAEKKCIKTSRFSGKLKSDKSFSKQKENSSSNSNSKVDDYGNTPNWRNDSGELIRLSFSSELKPSTPAKLGNTKANTKSSFLGRAGTVGLEKAVDVLDTLGSSMSNLNGGSGFVTGMASRGNKVYILAYEVANTIAKGTNLFQSLSEEATQFLKKEILQSEGVKQLVSTDMNELLSIAAADKREELDVFSREVIRFGNLCKDPQWHNLDRYFSRLDSEYQNNKQLKLDAETRIQELTILAQNTAELYHESHALDRFELDYRRKVEEVEALHLPKKGESIMMLHSELKHQKKFIRSLKKKSLWSRSLEEIVEKLVDVVLYIHQAIMEAFVNKTGPILVNKNPRKKPEKLGAAGLALHYANLINQMDNIASRPTSLPANIRDNLYHGLPISVKTSLRSRLQSFDGKQERSVSQVKAEMEKTLEWLVPLATNTTKAHQGFGWVGEWANTSNEYSKSTTANNITPTRLQTLYHADKLKVDGYILELVALLHHLISLVRHRDNNFKPTLYVRSPESKGGIMFHSKMQPSLSFNYGIKTNKTQFSEEERNLLDNLSRRRLIPGLSKSQEFGLAKHGKSRVWVLSRSTGSSPRTKEMSGRQTLEHPKGNILDVMDGLDFEFGEDS